MREVKGFDRKIEEKETEGSNVGQSNLPLLFFKADGSIEWMSL